MTDERDPGALFDRRRALAALGSAGMAATLGWPRPARAASGGVEPIVVGVLSELTGPGAAYGRDLLRGAQMALRDVNAAGGVQGRPLALMVADGATDPARSAMAMRRLVSADAALVVGGWGSAQVLANLEVSEEAGMPYIVVGATHPRVTAAHNRWTFRVIQSDTMQADALAAAVVGSLKARRVAALCDGSAYGTGSRDLFVKALARRGVSLQHAATYAVAAPDIGPHLSALRQAALDVLAVFGTVPAAPQVMRQAREAGIAARFVGTGGLAHEALPEAAAGAAEGTLLTGLFHEEADDEARAWSRRYRELFANALAPPQPQLAAWEYRAIRDIAAPCLAGGDPSRRAALRDRLAQWRGRLFGVAGEVAFDAQRQLTQPVLMLEVRGGRLVPWREPR